MNMQRISLLTTLVLFGMTGVGCADETSRQERLAQKLQSRFSAADTNKDGLLSAEEAKAGMPFVSRHFAEIDTGSKGSLSQDDIRAFLLEQAASRRAM